MGGQRPVRNNRRGSGAGGGAGGGPQDYDALAPLLRKLLEDRFGMKYHTEQRPATAYNLVALKPRMKKADPATRTSCKNAPAPAGSPPGSRSDRKSTRLNSSH